MSNPQWHGDTSRRIIKRIVLEGELELLTPAHLGNGDSEEAIDLPLLLDPLENRPLLTGASLAGALRAYLTDRADKASVERLFGGDKRDDEGWQSALIVEDALGRDHAVELRDGVGINSASRTADEDKLYNLQLWRAGTVFALRFELLICQPPHQADTLSDEALQSQERDMRQALATALKGLHDGDITLGTRKRRGFGRCKTKRWLAAEYDLKDTGGLLAWVEKGAMAIDRHGATQVALPDPARVLKVDRLLPLKQRRFTVRLRCAVDGSLLIGGHQRENIGPDKVHLHAGRRDGKIRPVLSGTSLGGALRARGRRIAATLGGAERADALVEAVFGSQKIKGKGGRRGERAEQASRLCVAEVEVVKAETALVQSRVAIDPFTGGARDTALFNEQPAFGGEVELDLRLLEPEDSHIGLLLLLLKDLWTGDLPLGAESSVGRGRLQGIEAELQEQGGDKPGRWRITAGEGNHLSVEGDAAALEHYVSALVNELNKAREETA